MSNRPDDLVGSIRKLVNIASNIQSQKNDLVKEIQSIQTEHKVELDKIQISLKHDFELEMENKISQLNHESEYK